MTGDRVRDEAERLVAAALTAISASLRAGQSAGPALATGSAECCVCPVCRAIAAVRDPSSDLADRLATGVGDVAAGVAAVLRTLSQRGDRAESPAPATEGDQFWAELRRRAADAARSYGRPPTPDPDESTVDDPWRAATRDPAGPADEPTAHPVPSQATKAAPKKAVAKKAVTKKAVAKKAVRKAASRGGAE